MGEELRALARFVGELRLETVPDDVVRAARFCVLDTLGSALGATRSREIQAITAELEDWSGVGKNHRLASAWGQGTRTSLNNAVLVNGMLSHELELDDVHTASKSHVGAVVVPAAWTVADAMDLGGKELLEAVIAGYEVMGRVGRAMDVASNRKRGWHTTGVIGTFGAAAAAAKLWGLTEQETVNTFGIAGTQSSGLWAFLAEGTTCKKLHPARAALNGVTACLLVKSGMTGAEHILDAADGGLYQAVSDRYDMARLVEGLGEGYEIMKVDKKPYPCCRTTHHAIDGALQLREEGVLPEQIASVLVETYEVGVLQCGFPEYPRSPVEAKFSIPFTCAAAFVRGHVGLSEFSAEVLEDPQVQRIAQVTIVREAPLFSQRYPSRWGSCVTVTLTDGTTWVCQVDDMSGSVAKPLTARQEEEKFRSLAQVWDSSCVEELLGTVMHLEQQERLPDLSGTK